MLEFGFKVDIFLPRLRNKCPPPPVLLLILSVPNYEDYFGNIY